MNSREFLMLIAMVANDLNESNNTINNINNTLESLDRDKSGVVEISLTISKIKYKFVKVLGEWGVMCANGSWEPFRIIPMGEVDKMANAIKKVANK